MNTIKIKDTSDIPENFTGIIEYPNGDKSWYKNDLIHREDGPAFESSNRKEWYLNNSYYKQIILKNYIVLDEYKGKYGLIWYKLLDKDKIVEYPDIPGLITK